MVPSEVRERMRSRFRGRNVGIWGFRAEGVAALDFVQRFEPDRVTIVDDKARAPRLSELDGLARVPIVGPFTGPDAATELLACDVVVKSAGVSRYGDVAAMLEQHGTELVGGMGLFFELVDPARLVAVTGTKGKSTTATAIHHILTRAGHRSVLVGNVGEPVLARVDALLDDDATCVVEVSSYQASEITRSPARGCFTSLHPDHLDWHGTFDRYVTDKTNLFAHPASSVEVHVGPGLETHPALTRLPATLRPYGTHGRATVDRDRLRLDGHEVTRAERLRIRGPHNLVNLCGAVSVAAEVLGDPTEARRAAAAALETMEPLSDRLEVVGVVDGVSFALDSLATIPQATIAALDAHADTAVVLIAGGLDRGQDHADLAARIVRSSNVAAVLGLPDTGHRLTADVRAALAAGGLGRDDLVVVDTDDLGHAVGLAAARADPGATVLLSPAAASFNRYLDYHELGRHYRELVAGLRRAEATNR